MNLVFTIDHNYINPFSVTLYSLIKNTNCQNINVYIIHDDLKDEHQNQIKNRFFRYPVKFNFIEFKVSMDELKTIDTNHLPTNVLYRLLLDKVLPQHLDKILFLDADLLILQDINELYHIDISEYYLAGVTDLLNDIYLNLNLESIYDYFNAGVLLINLKKWRENGLSNQLIEYAKLNMTKLRYADQDILNGTIRGSWFRLHPKWNVISNVFENPQFFEKNFSKDLRLQLISDPAIVHFTGDVKPWSNFSDHPYTNIYKMFQNELSLDFKSMKIQNINFKIGLFGASLAAENITKKLSRLSIKVENYFDNSEKKWGSKINGREVLNPKKLPQLCLKENYKIIIASSYINEISKQLKDYGLKENVHFFKNLSSFERYILKGDY